MPTVKVKGKVIKCPDCGNGSLWSVGLVPTREGKKQRVKCTECARTFYAEDYVPKRDRTPKQVSLNPKAAKLEVSPLLTD